MNSAATDEDAVAAAARQDIEHRRSCSDDAAFGVNVGGVIALKSEHHDVDSPAATPPAALARDQSSAAHSCREIKSGISTVDQSIEVANTSPASCVEPVQVPQEEDSNLDLMTVPEQTLSDTKSMDEPNSLSAMSSSAALASNAAEDVDENSAESLTMGRASSCLDTHPILVTTNDLGPEPNASSGGSSDTNMRTLDTSQNSPFASSDTFPDDNRDCGIENVIELSSILTGGENQNIAENETRSSMQGNHPYVEASKSSPKLVGDSNLIASNDETRLQNGPRPDLHGARKVNEPIDSRSTNLEAEATGSTLSGGDKIIQSPPDSRRDDANSPVNSAEGQTTSISKMSIVAEHAKHELPAAEFSRESAHCLSSGTGSDFQASNVALIRKEIVSANAANSKHAIASSEVSKGLSSSIQPKDNANAAEGMVTGTVLNCKADTQEGSTSALKQSQTSLSAAASHACCAPPSVLSSTVSHIQSSSTSASVPAAPSTVPSIVPSATSCAAMFSASSSASSSTPSDFSTLPSSSSNGLPPSSVASSPSPGAQLPAATSASTTACATAPAASPLAQNTASVAQAPLSLATSSQPGTLGHRSNSVQKPSSVLPSPTRCPHPACCKQRAGVAPRGSCGISPTSLKNIPAPVHRSATAIAPNPHGSISHRHTGPRLSSSTGHAHILASSLPPCCRAALPPCCLKAGIAPAQLAPRPRCAAPVAQSPAKSGLTGLNVAHSITPTKAPLPRTQHAHSPSTPNLAVNSSAHSYAHSMNSSSPVHPSTPRTTFGDGEHVTIWNRVERRKIAGNAAPLGKNLLKYLDQHKDCEVYHSQDLDLSGNRTSKKRSQSDTEIAAGDHVAIWNKRERRKIAGNAAPLMKNLASYLAKRPDCEPYKSQDVELKKEAQQRKLQKLKDNDCENPSVHDEPPSLREEQRSEYESVADMEYGSSLRTTDENYCSSGVDANMSNEGHESRSHEYNMVCSENDSSDALDAWRALDSEAYPSKTDLEQAAEFLYHLPLPKDDDDDVSLAVLTGPDELPILGMNVDQLGNLDIKAVLEIEDSLVDEVLEDIDQADSPSSDIVGNGLPSLTDPLSGF